jgi:predicted ATPase
LAVLLCSRPQIPDFPHFRPKPLERYKRVAEIERGGQHWCEVEAHRVRGEILLKRDPVNTAPAEEAFLTAIAVAQEQKARSFELRAALSLAKLYQSTGRAPDAHAVLAPALEGFSPTPEMPDIEQAQVLINAFAETDEVKNAAAARQRRLQLQTSYGSALLQARGMHSPETRNAFSRARELAVGPQDPSERFSVHYGLWAGHYVRGELAPMREIAELVLREVETRPDSTEAVVAVRLNGATQWFAGDFTAARSFLERALAVFDPQRHGDEAFRFAQDIGVTITAYLALVLWVLGEVERARTIAEQTMARATQTGHVGTIGYAHFHFAVFEMMRRSVSAAAPHIKALVDVSRAHEMGMWTAYGKFLAPWSRCCMGGADASLAEMRDGIATCRDQGLDNYLPFFATTLAEVEAEAGEIEAALTTIDGVIAETKRTGQQWFDAESYRIRGEILWKRDLATPAPAEQAFLTAITIAKQQKARSFELRAALSLARLWRDQGKRENARELLAQVYGWFTEGFDTLDLQEAKALLDELHT